MTTGSRNSACGERGAAMVFGVFFAVFLVGVVYQVMSLAEVVVYREHMQDAADAVAFSAAVVQARGMNLLALINMIMAAVLSVFVGLRIAQTLGLVAIGICGALAWPTGGASLAAIPPLATATQQVAKAAERVKDKLPSLLGALHRAGKAVSVVVPIGSNARALDMAERYGVLSVALPGRVTLPVRDGSFLDLCRHAAELAGDVALLPLSPILPKPVRRRIDGSIARLAEAGSGWFCGEGDEPPDLDDDRDSDLLERPVLPTRRECDRGLARAASADEAELAALEEACDAAAVEYLASMPGRDGHARAGEPLCPSDCADSDRSTCPPVRFDACEPALRAHLDDVALKVLGTTRVPDGKGSPYELRLELARIQCEPERGRALLGHWWLERTVTYTYVWVSAGTSAARGEYRRVGMREGPERFVRHDDKDTTHPCGEGGVYAAEYRREGSTICESAPVCVGEATVAPCGREVLRRRRVVQFEEQATRVTELVRCAERSPHDSVRTPPLNLSKELGTGGDGRNTSPLRVDPGAWLGGSDYQVRAVAIGPHVKHEGLDATALAAWGEEGGDPLIEGASAWGRIGLSQAEFFFDVAAFPDLDDPTDDRDVVEWLWVQGWRARLRPFRLRQREADGPRDDLGTPDREQMPFLERAGSSTSPDELPCPGDSKACRGLSALRRAL